ncbi:hypothetical protein J5991_03635, partial [Methanocorpusculum sp.]|nr:hypothetical protein [Methanocorpusculum sp.]
RRNALLCDVKIYFCSSKAAATAGFAEGKTATSCATVRSHQRNQRFFSKGDWCSSPKIQLRSKASPPTKL